MYFSFDKPKSTVHNNNPVEDKSGHFNDASTSRRAHTSSRAYGKKFPFSFPIFTLQVVSQNVDVVVGALSV
jgi:hypothetical protein